MSSLKTAYEEVIYPSAPRAASAPDRLAAVATLFGLCPPNPATARVLEIGCSDGGNLTPMAVVATEGRFLGIDFAAPAVLRGQERIRDLGLTNVELRALDVMEFPEDSGLFDYIIAHGVFSWVPLPVRTKILALIQRHLAPDGVAYIDYNAQPGGQLRYAFRESMLFHVRRFSDPQQRIDQARSLLKIIIDSNPEKSLYRTLAENELKRLLRTTAHGLFHDDLSEPNDPLYFHEFIAAAADHDLQYLGEADVSEMNDARLPANAREAISRLRSVIEREQYFDILKGRLFRQTLLSRKGSEINRAVTSGPMRLLWFSSPVAMNPGPGEGELTFQAEDGAVTTSNPLAKAALGYLVSVFPAWLSVSDLADAVRRSHSELIGQDDESLFAILLHAVMAGVVTIHAGPAPFTTGVSEMPLASPLARHQIARGESVSTLDFRSIAITDEIERRVLPLLDGNHPVAQIAEQENFGVPVVMSALRRLTAKALLIR